MEQMNQEKLGAFIAQKRKEKKLTQKDIADKLMITDKAVSKWERGLSYPDMALLPELAAILDISAEEIIYGKIRSSNTATAAQSEQLSKVVDTLETYKKNEFTEKTTHLFFSILTIICVATSVSCLLIDFLSNGQLFWSLFVASAAGLLWTGFAPFFILKHKEKYIIGLICLAVSTTIYFFIIQLLTKTDGWVLRVGLPCIIGILITCIAFILIKRKVSAAIIAKEKMSQMEVVTDDKI